jgi:hypothetical protein
VVLISEPKIISNKVSKTNSPVKENSAARISPESQQKVISNDESSEYSDSSEEERSSHLDSHGTSSRVRETLHET